MRAKTNQTAFTLIEMIVVLAIVALLVTIVSPSYFRSVARARENSMRTSLGTLRDAVDKFAADQGRYPATLEELVVKRYIRMVPKDPLTGRSDTWLLTPAPADSLEHGNVYDIHSGAPGESSDGVLLRAL